MLKKALSLLVVVAMMLSLSGCGGAFFFFLSAMGDDRTDKEDISQFVCEKETELLEAIESGDFSQFENQGFIHEIDRDKKVVDFSCGGAGMGSGTSYVGFYYTPDDDMAALSWCGPHSAAALKPAGNGYEWQESNGDNRYYTEHICGNFYYYEASF